MRRTLAAVADVALVALLGYLGFLLAVAVAPCHSNMGNCPLLAPLILVFVILAVVLYFGAGYFRWRTTPGERLFRP